MGVLILAMRTMILIMSLSLVIIGCTTLNNVNTEVQEDVLGKICDFEDSPVKVSKCTDFYSTYPAGFIVDADTKIYDSNGNFLVVSRLFWGI